MGGTDIPEFLYEGNRLSHDGTLVVTVYVDTREPKERHPIPLLVKGCRSEHVAQTGSRIKVTAPPVFHTEGENLIRDESEGRVIIKRLEKVTEHVNDPQDVAMVRELLPKVEEALLNIGVDLTVKDVTTMSRNRVVEEETYTFAPKGWLFCTSVCPTTPEEWAAWQSTLESGYDAKYYIYRPREFAMALGQMLASQIGPRGPSAPLRSSSSGHAWTESVHPSQMVLHGPVVYKDDVLAWLKEARTASEFLRRSVFTKHQTHLSQREYRFYVHSDIGPGEPCYLLDASPGLLATTVEQEGDPSPPVYYETKQLDREVGEEVEPNPLRTLLSLLGPDSP